MKPEAFLLRIAGVVQRKPWAIVITVVLLTLVSGAVARNMVFETDAMAFLPENEIVDGH